MVQCIATFSDAQKDLAINRPIMQDTFITTIKNSYRQEEVPDIIGRLVTTSSGTLSLQSQTSLVTDANREFQLMPELSLIMENFMRLT